MIKFKQLMTFGVGNKSVSFTGREPFRVENDAAFEIALLALGVFERLDDGSLRYSGRVTVIDNDGVEHRVDAEGRLPLKKSDLHGGADKEFI